MGASPARAVADQDNSEWMLHQAERQKALRQAGRQVSRDGVNFIVDVGGSIEKFHDVFVGVERAGPSQTSEGNSDTGIMTTQHGDFVVVIVDNIAPHGETTISQENCATVV
jgi:hypothetical protein